MFRYIVKRILIFVPTFLVISWITFGLSQLAPGDPVDVMLSGGVQGGQLGEQAEMRVREEAYMQMRAQLGLDKPVFYFSLTTAAYPDTLYKITPQIHRATLSRLIDQYGNWPEISAYYAALRRWQQKSFDLPDSLPTQVRTPIRRYTNDLFLVYDSVAIQTKLRRLVKQLAPEALRAWRVEAEALQASYTALLETATPHLNYWPKLSIQGWDNQYHHWITGVLRGDLGYSYVDNQPVHQKLGGALRWTLWMNVISIFLAYLISIPVGVHSALWRAEDKQHFALLDWRWRWPERGRAGYALRRSLQIILGIGAVCCIVASVGLLVYGFFWVSWTVRLFVLSVGVLIIGWRYWRRGRKAITFRWPFEWRQTGIYVKGGRLDDAATSLLFVWYSLPSFWVGTLLIIFFTTDTYSSALNIFPTGGILSDGINEDTAWLPWLSDVLYHLVLPVFCITYGSFAFIARQMRGGMLNVFNQDYMRTATAKGLPKRTVIWKHGLRNALFPIITLFASVFPRAMSGSVAIEFIYSIPGMGRLALTSITARDWPVLFAILMFAALLTMLGNLFADLLYAKSDPRVTFKS